MSKTKNPELDFFGSRLRSVRKAAGLTGTEFAKKIGISQGSLSEIETGKTAPAFATIENIIKNTNIDIVWLFTGVTKQRQPAKATDEIPNYFINLIDWARETSGTGNLDWFENLLDTCLPAFKTWREQKKSGAETASLHQDQINRRVA